MSLKEKMAHLAAIQEFVVEMAGDDWERFRKGLAAGV